MIAPELSEAKTRWIKDDKITTHIHQEVEAKNVSARVKSSLAKWYMRVNAVG